MLFNCQPAQLLTHCVGHQIIADPVIPQHVPSQGSCTAMSLSTQHTNMHFQPSLLTSTYLLDLANNTQNQTLAPSALSTMFYEQGNTTPPCLHMVSTGAASFQYTPCYIPVLEHTIQATGTFSVSFHSIRCPNHISDISLSERCQC